MNVASIKCPKCQDIIYSRARHDFHHCSCEAIFIDGGFNYIRYGAETSLMKRIKVKSMSVHATKGELYQDWNMGFNFYGKINLRFIA